MSWVPRNLAMPLFLVWHPFCCLSKLQADFPTTVSSPTNEWEYFAFVSASAISSADQKKCECFQQQCVVIDTFSLTVLAVFMVMPFND